MIVMVPRPIEQPTPLELRVSFLVVRADGSSKRFEQFGMKPPPDQYSWGPGNHYASSGEVLIPVDPWTAVKTHMCTFEELQLPESARALLNIIK